MAEHIARVTRGGRVPVPIAVRRALRIVPGDQVEFVIEDETSATLLRIAPNVRSVQGVIQTPPRLQTDDLDDRIEQAMSDHADWVVKRMHEGLE